MEDTQEELEVAPAEEDLLFVDTDLDATTAILTYSRSPFPAQRHAYIRGMGAAALHSDSLSQVGSLIHAALELLAQLQEAEGAHELAGDEQAEVLVLQQLGPLGCAWAWLSQDQDAQRPEPTPTQPTSTDTGMLSALLDACAHALVTHADAADYTSKCSPTAWPAAWLSCSAHASGQDSAPNPNRAGRLPREWGAVDAESTHSAALLSYGQVLGLLPFGAAHQAALRHVGQALHASQQASAEPQLQRDSPQALVLPERLAPKQAAAALSMLAALGHARAVEMPKMQAEGAGTDQLGLQGASGDSPAPAAMHLRDLTASLLVRLTSPAPAPEGAPGMDEEACQMVAVAHLPPLATSLLRPSLADFEAVLLPVLQGLARSASWAVRRNVAGVLPGMVAMLVVGAGEASEAGCGDLASESLAAGRGQGGSCDESTWLGVPELAVCREGGEFLEGDGMRRRVRAGGQGLASLGAAACELLHLAPASTLCPGTGTTGHEQQQQHGCEGQRGERQAQLHGGHKAESESSDPHWEGSAQQQQQRRQGLQQMCAPLLHLLVSVLGTSDVSHWVRSAAVAAAGPALCVLPRWLASQQTDLLHLYCNAVLAARPHAVDVLATCASCFGKVVSKVGAQAWAAPSSPLPASYASLMQPGARAGSSDVLQATVAELPVLAAVLGPTSSQEQLLPPLMALVPSRLHELRKVFADRATLVQLASALPPAGAAELLGLLPAMCNLDAGKEEGRCGRWRERLGLAHQVSGLAIEALRASPPDERAGSKAFSSNPSGLLSSRHAATGSQASFASADVSDVTVMLGSLGRSASPFSSLAAQGEAHVGADQDSTGTQCQEREDGQTHASRGWSLCAAAVLHAASVLLHDPVWAVRRATVGQLRMLSHLRHDQ